MRKKMIHEMDRNTILMSLLATLLFFAASTTLMAQDDDDDYEDVGPYIGLNIGAATWFNQCDVPQAEQSSDLQPAYGPFLSFTYGKFRLETTYFDGRFHVDAQDGIQRNTNDVEFRDEVAQRKRFTTTGYMERQDFGVSVRYTFNRYAAISLGATMNRHVADISLLLEPSLGLNGEIILPTDANNRGALDYTSTQWWITEGFHGSVAVETVSSRFAIFYNTSLMILGGESGSSTAEKLDGETEDFDTGRLAYRWEGDGQTGGLVFDPLEERSTGTNAGFSFSSGLSFELFDQPSLLLFAGYNFKFFAEKETDLIDHSTFHGPYFGLSWNVL